MTTMHTFRNAEIGGGIRHEVFEGRDQLVVPVVMIVEGVLNGALVPEAEFARYPEAWNGRPVPVLHPERDGVPVSANSPDVIERNTIGRLFNAYADNGKLKGEAWLDTDKAHRLGHGQLLDALEAGEIVEVSTGYFADSEPKVGDHGGRAYQEIHRNIRPDHLALLPGEEGACSVADGCGTRVNRKGFVMQTKEALDTLAKALGLRAQCSGGCTGQCNCGGDMPEATKKALVQRATKLHANEKLTADQMEMLQNLAEDEQQLTMAKAFLDAVEASAGEPAEPNPDEMAEDEHMLARMAANKKFVERLNKLATNSQGGGEGVGQGETVSAEKVDEIVAQRVDERIRRNAVIDKLKTNERCPFSDGDMQAMSVDHLEKLEQSIRPADYSGAAGFAANAAPDTDVTPLVPKGALARNAEQRKEG